MQYISDKYVKIRSNIVLFYVLITYIFGVILYEIFNKQLKISVIDELLVVFLFVIWFNDVYNRKLIIINKKVIYLIFFVIFNIIYSIMIKSNLLNAILIDTFISFKSLAALLLIVDLNISFNSIQKKILKIFSILIFIYLLMTSYPFERIYLYWGHPSRQALAAIITFLIFFYSSIFNKQNILFSWIILVLGILSERNKFYGEFILIIYIMFYNCFYKKIFTRKLYNVIFLFVVIMLMGVAVYKKIYQVIFLGLISCDDFSQVWARPALYIVSLRIFYDYFPFGSGAASFGSWYSGVYYSSMYEKYGLSNNYGLQKHNFNFVSDTYFPQIIAQFGFIGMILYFTLMIFPLYEVSKKYNNDLIKERILIHIMYIIFIVESIADSTIVQNRGVFLCTLLGIFYNEIKRNKKQYDIKI